MKYLLIGFLFVVSVAGAQTASVVTESNGTFSLQVAPGQMWLEELSVNGPIQGTTATTSGLFVPSLPDDSRAQTDGPLFDSSWSTDGTTVLSELKLIREYLGYVCHALGYVAGLLLSMLTAQGFRGWFHV
jgi:hypothetical protein